MTPVSLVCSYYDDPRRLFDLAWNPTTFDYFDEIIIVDDGSQKHLARDVLVDLIADEPSLSDRVRLFRIPWDYGFNNHGGRNLAMRYVRNEWCTLIDVDNVMGLELRLEDAIDHLSGNGGRPVVTGLAAALAEVEAHGDDRHPQKGRLHRRGHGARVEHVDSDVGTRVHARDGRIVFDHGHFVAARHLAGRVDPNRRQHFKGGQQAS